MSKDKKARNHQLWDIVASRKMIAAADAEELYILIMSYFRWCDENPLEVPELIRSGKDAGDMAYKDVPQPYSITGLCLYCGITIQYLKYISTCEDPEYKTVGETALMIIQNQNTNWAMVGVFSPIMTSKIHSIGNSDGMIEATSQVNITVLGEGAPPLLENENEIILKDKRAI